MIESLSRPTDLVRPERLWARAVTMAVTEIAATGGTEYALDDEGFWCHATGAGGWWRLSLHDGGRAVFAGQDPDADTHVCEERPDFLAGGPQWLPWELLRDDADGNLLGFLYWWQGDAWERAPYPADAREDGLRLAAEWVGPDDAEFRSEAVGPCELPREQEERLAGAVLRFAALAETRSVDAGAVAELVALAGDGAGTPAAEREAAVLAFATRAGVTTGA